MNRKPQFIHEISSLESRKIAFIRKERKRRLIPRLRTSGRRSCWSGSHDQDANFTWCTPAELRLEERILRSFRLFHFDNIKAGGSRSHLVVIRLAVRNLYFPSANRVAYLWDVFLLNYSVALRFTKKARENPKSVRKDLKMQVFFINAGISGNTKPSRTQNFRLKYS